MNFKKREPVFFWLNNPKSRFNLSPDSSLLYSGRGGDYSILLNGNWHFELMVDSRTGLCTHAQCFLRGLNVSTGSIHLPGASPADLYFSGDDPLEPWTGCHYQMSASDVIWDSVQEMLFIGNQTATGDAVEFAPNNIAIIDGNKLIGLCLVLKDIGCNLFFDYFKP